jgi:hypothetical protein
VGWDERCFATAPHESQTLSDSIGIRGSVVHAISEQAKAFYLALGFEPSQLDPMTLMVTLGDVQAILGVPAE